MQIDNLNLIAQTLYDKKGFNILAIDVRGVSTMVDYFVFAEGSVDRHVIALADAVVDELAKNGVELWQIEGEKFGDWVVMDFGDTFVHIFTPEMREKYRLETVWSAGRVVDLQLTKEVK